MSMAGKPVLSTLGAVAAAFVSSLCCIGPLLYVGLGVGAGLASTFEPLRPWFLGLAVVLLGIGFYATYGRRYRCAAGSEAERRRRRQAALLWIGTAVVALVASFPVWSMWLL